MNFLSDFCAIPQDILEKVGQGVARKCGKKGTKSIFYNIGIGSDSLVKFKRTMR